MNEPELLNFPFWSRYYFDFMEMGVTDQELGSLVRAMGSYQFQGIDLGDTLSPECKYLWLCLRRDLDYARAKYIASIENGKKGGRKRTQPNPEETQQNPTEPNRNPAKPESESKSKSESKPESKTKTKAKTKSSFSKDIYIPGEKTAYGEFGWVLLTEKQYQRLRQELGEAELNRCIAYLDEAAQSTGNKNRWKDWNLMIKRCHRSNWCTTPPEAPHSSTTRLGEAELEAIHQTPAAPLPEMPAAEL